MTSKYTERQKELARTVMDNIGLIMIIMALLLVGSLCFNKAGEFAADLSQRRWLLFIQIMIIIIQGTLVVLLLWTRKVIRHGKSS